MRRSLPCRSTSRQANCKSSSLSSPPTTASIRSSIRSRPSSRSSRWRGWWTRRSRHRPRAEGASVAEPSTSHDLLAAAAHALRGDRTRVRDLLAGVKERAEDRARDAIAQRLEGARQTVAPTAPATPLPKPAVPRLAPKVAPDWPVDIRFADGRRLRATIAPGVARRRDLVALSRVGEANDRRAFAAIAHQRESL